MNDLTISHNHATITIDEAEGGIAIKIEENDNEATKFSIYSNNQAQIWLDKRASHRLCQFLKDFLAESTEDDDSNC